MQPDHRAQADWRGPRGIKCANCQSEAHSTRDCPKPRIPEDQRLCHGCGKPGHIRAKCPQNRRVQTVDTAEDEDYAFNVDFECQDCEWTYQKGHKRRPEPSKVTIGDFIKPKLKEDFRPIHVANKFEALSEETNYPEEVKKKKKNGQTTTIKEIRRKVSPKMVPNNEPNDANDVDISTINAVMEPHEHDHDHEQHGTTNTTTTESKIPETTTNTTTTESKIPETTSSSSAIDVDSDAEYELDCEAEDAAIEVIKQGLPCPYRMQEEAKDQRMGRIIPVETPPDAISGVTGGMGLPSEEAHPAETPSSRPKVEKIRRKKESKDERMPELEDSDDEEAHRPTKPEATWRAPVMKHPCRGTCEIPNAVKKWLFTPASGPRSPGASERDKGADLPNDSAHAGVSLSGTATDTYMATSTPSRPTKSILQKINDGRKYTRRRCGPCWAFSSERTLIAPMELADEDEE